MGVTQLWQILAPVEQHKTLSSLAGQTLAVDLSIWVCENQCVKQMQGVVTKPYLRNVFFRICHLTQLGVKLVFVIEGSAPELKWDTMAKRQQTRFPGRPGVKGASSQKPAGKQKRGNFNNCLKECCELLEILGIPYVQSKGEAEALCAVLNMAGLVDGCLTNDGDCFLYGATTVYRNFTMNSKDPHVEMYTMSDIECQLGIDRSGLVALGLLIGCDYVPKGVPGIGLANAVKLLQSLQGRDVIARLREWREMSESECIDQIEVLARRKAIAVPDFPQLKVVDEFMIAADRCPSRLSPWKRPVLPKLQEFAQVKMEWPVEYSLEKILPLVTLWDMTDILQSRNPSRHQHLKPHRIVKTRVRQGEPCFEVEWHKPVSDTQHEDSYYVTVEPQDVFSRCFPDRVLTFNTATETKKKNKNKKKKKTKDKTESVASLENLSFQLDKLNIGDVTDKLAKSVKDLKPDFCSYSEASLTTKAKQPKHLTMSSVTSKPVMNSRSQTSTEKPVQSLIKTKSHGALLHSQKQNVTKGVFPNSIASGAKTTDAIMHTNSGQGLRVSKSESSPLFTGRPTVTKQADGRKLFSSEQNNGVSSVDTSSPNVTDDKHIPLSERVKLRLQGKQAVPTLNPRRPSVPYESVKTVNTPINNSRHGSLHEDDLSNMSSLLQEVENLSFKGAGGTEIPGKGCLPQVNTNFPITPNICPSKVGRPNFRAFSTSAKCHQISSPALESFCSPLTFFKQSMASEGRGEVKSSPIPVIDADDSLSETGPPQNPTMDSFSSPFLTNADGESKTKPKPFSCSAEALASKIASGITSVGKPKEKEFDSASFSFFDKPKKAEPAPRKITASVPTKSQMQMSVQNKMPGLIDNLTPSLGPRTQPQPANKSQQTNLSQLGLSMSDLGIDSANASQLGDFQIQTSLLNSMCSSLIQALTPKGVSMSKEEYESLMATLSELDSESESMKPKTKIAKKLEQRIDKLAEEVVCNIDFSDVEKASASLKKIRPEVTLEPIRLLGESNKSADQNEPLSKTAKKRLRRKERQKALEDIAHLNNMTQRLKEGGLDSVSLQNVKEANQSHNTNKNDTQKTSYSKESSGKKSNNKQSRGSTANKKTELNDQHIRSKTNGKQNSESKGQKQIHISKENKNSGQNTSMSGKAASKQRDWSKDNKQSLASQLTKENQKSCQNTSTKTGGKQNRGANNSRSHDGKSTSNQNPKHGSTSGKDEKTGSIDNDVQKNGKPLSSSNSTHNKSNGDSKNSAKKDQGVGSRSKVNSSEKTSENALKMNRKERRKTQAENNGFVNHTMEGNENLNSCGKKNKKGSVSLSKKSTEDESLGNTNKSGRNSPEGDISIGKSNGGRGKSKRKGSTDVDKTESLVSTKGEGEYGKKNSKQVLNPSKNSSVIQLENVKRHNTNCKSMTNSNMGECGSVSNGTENTTTPEVTSAKPKKKKKKKVKKASPFINLSADGSMNFGSTTKIAQYLNNALLRNNVRSTQNSGIQKASPVIELSADEDTLLELDSISSLLTRDSAKAANLKKQKLKLSLQKNKRQVNLDKNETNGITGVPILASEDLLNQANEGKTFDRKSLENEGNDDRQEFVEYAKFNDNIDGMDKVESESAGYNVSSLPVFDDILCDDDDDDDTDDVNDDDDDVNDGGESEKDDDRHNDDDHEEKQDVCDYEDGFENTNLNNHANKNDKIEGTPASQDNDTGECDDDENYNDGWQDYENDAMKNVDDHEDDTSDEHNDNDVDSEDDDGDDDDDDKDIYSDYGMDIVSEDELNQLAEIQIGEPDNDAGPENEDSHNLLVDYFNKLANDTPGAWKNPSNKSDRENNRRLDIRNPIDANEKLARLQHVTGIPVNECSDKEDEFRGEITFEDYARDKSVEYEKVPEGARKDVDGSEEKVKCIVDNVCAMDQVENGEVKVGLPPNPIYISDSERDMHDMRDEVNYSVSHTKAHDLNNDEADKHEVNYIDGDDNGFSSDDFDNSELGFVENECDVQNVDGGCEVAGNACNGSEDGQLESVNLDCSGEYDQNTCRSDSSECIDIDDIDVHTYDDEEEPNGNTVHETDFLSSIDHKNENSLENGFKLFTKTSGVDQGLCAESTSKGDDIDCESKTVIMNGFSRDTNTWNTVQGFIWNVERTECYTHGNTYDNCDSTDLRSNNSKLENSNYEITNLNPEYTSMNFQLKKQGSEIVNPNYEFKNPNSEIKNQNSDNTTNLNGAVGGETGINDISHFETGDIGVESSLNGFHTDLADNITSRRNESYANEKNLNAIDDLKIEAAQSPACLADRLKMKLRNRSTRNVLDSFTGGKSFD